MKILQINSVCGVGSTGRIATDLYKVIEENGHECLIAYGRGNSPQGFNTYKIGNKFDNYFHVLITRLFDKHGLASRRATKKLIKKIEEYNPDVIHLHNIHGYYINIEILFNYLSIANKPVVWTLHDSWAFTGHCVYFDYVGCEKWLKLCNKCPQKNEYPKSHFFDSSITNYNKKKELFMSVENLTIITPSEWLSNLVKQSFLNKYPITVINNGIDLEIFKPSESDFRKKLSLENKFLILGVANIWDRRKGLGTFIELSKHLNDEYKIVLVGLSEQLKKMLPNNIIGITRTNNIQELAELYSTADVFINPTLEDNFPTTNIEALACGTPVITFNTGGSVESIDESCGIVIKLKKLSDLINNILILKEKNFSKENCIKKANDYRKTIKYYDYLNLYDRRINKSEQTK